MAMTPDPFDAVCVGETMGQLTPDPPRPLREAPSLRLDIAGAESNVAIYLARLGARVAWASHVGADPFGELIIERVTAAGVDTSMVVVDLAAPTGVYFKDPGPQGTCVHYYRHGSAAAAMDRSVFDHPLIAAPRILHLSGITPALSSSCADMVSHALRGMAGRPTLASFDINYRAGLWPVSQAAPTLAALANEADLVFVGLDEAHNIWGAGSPHEVRAILTGPGTLVVKDGAVGATSFGPHGTTFVPSPPVNVVEPVGAGDAFAAGYLYGVLRDVAESARLHLGHLVAAAALRVAGDIGPLPPTDELLKTAQLHITGDDSDVDI